MLLREQANSFHPNPREPVIYTIRVAYPKCCPWTSWNLEEHKLIAIRIYNMSHMCRQLSLNGHLYKTDTSKRETPELVLVSWAPFFSHFTIFNSL